MRSSTAVFTLLSAILYLNTVSARTSNLGYTPARRSFLQPRACPSGQYQNGNQPCQPCTAGYSCAGGTRTACPKGQYQPSTGQTSCQTCPSGQYTSSTGQTGCATADPGYSAPGPGAQGQTQCGKGNYSSAGAGSCTQCPTGSYCDSDTTGTPTKCPAGTYNPNKGSDSANDCEDCERGTFQSSTGASTCCTCCSGFYASNKGQTSCTQCTGGRTSDPGSTNSGSCKVGSNPPRSTTCAVNDNKCPATTPGGPSSVPIQARRKRFVSECEAKGPGYKRCPINGGHECLNVLTEFDSCGGCTTYDAEDELDKSNVVGQDCGAIRNASNVTCQRGRCVVATCRKGFQVSSDSGSCVAAAARKFRRSSL